MVVEKLLDFGWGVWVCAVEVPTDGKFLGLIVFHGRGVDRDEA